MELIFVRHVQPDIAAGVCYGQLDVPLKQGYVDAHKAIVIEGFDAVYSSPLSRCQLLAKQLSATYVCDARLMELNFGAWEGMAWSAIDRAALDEWGAQYITVSPPGGESLQQLVDRLADFLKELKEKSFEKVVIVCHAGVIRAAMHLLEGRSLYEIMGVKINYGGIYTFNLI